jgi:hypothetical protein
VLRKKPRRATIHSARSSIDRFSVSQRRVEEFSMAGA